MGWLTSAHHRQIHTKGRQMLLMTADRNTSVTVMGYAPPAQVAQITDATAQTAFIAQITNDELASSGYGSPGALDRLRDGTRTYTLTDATAVYDGSTLCGWTLIAAGGETS